MREVHAASGHKETTFTAAYEEEQEGCMQVRNSLGAHGKVPHAYTLPWRATRPRLRRHVQGRFRMVATTAAATPEINVEDRERVMAEPEA